MRPSANAAEAVAAPRRRRRRCTPSIIASRSSAAQGFHFAAPFLGGETVFFRGLVRPGRAARLRTPRRLLHERDEPRAGRFPVLTLRAVFAAVDQQEPIR